ncbi:hypothetical protein GCM10011444_09590 [Winogradskyella haliclonae]|uniref:DUF4440 domain-containing protein n=1 Tax=Winogradskyella haliclonae TaxID=2048558 RepID=A0ABQ2BW20_9FLAO|nr:hypothetical protein GCM10011444_09590 [Winogradskyella haliclonae]
MTNLKDINKTWEKFYKAFDNLDYTLMANIHSEKLIRISGGNRITDYKTYINNYKATFDRARENKTSNTIALRFFERISNDSTASERGVYKLTRIENGKSPKSYYGQFHVIFIKENNTWKILMDYDSSEGNTIGEEAYQKARDINNFDAFKNN